MILHLRRWTSLTPAVLLAAGGCLASKGDIRLLQDQLLSMQSTQARADSLRRLQTDSALRLIARANDSLRALDTRVAAFQAKTSGDLYDINRQLITVQELAGLSQRALQKLKASLDERAEAAAAAGAAAPSAPATPGTPAATGVGQDSTQPPSAPTEAVLYQTGLDQMGQASYAAARSAFQDLLTRYPKSDDAPMAQLYVGQSFELENNPAPADSVYQLVASMYPQSPSAATALYKYAQSQLKQGHRAEARAALNRVIRDYPNSDEHGLAADLLKTIK